MLRNFEPLIYYADPALEKACDIPLRKAKKGEVASVQDEVSAMIASLSKKEFAVEPPPRGFLAAELTPKQRSLLNESLGPQYAARNIAQQREIVQVPIVESGERMVHLPSFLDEHGVRASFSRTKFHEACEEFAGKDRIAYVRRSVAELLADAFAALGKVHLKPYVEDCWRPPAVQRGLYKRRLQGVARSTDWNPALIEEVTSSLTAPFPGVAGHQAGAAIDWRLQDPDGKLLDLGNLYGEGKPVSSIHFPYVTFDQWRTRTLFKALMQSAGLKLLDTEDWHASYGDRGMSIEKSVRKVSARYGPLLEFDRITGEVQPYAPEDMDTPHFTTVEIERIIADARAK